ncbi:MAG: nodulation protein NfeD [Chitinophagaceae bacterium]
MKRITIYFAFLLSLPSLLSAQTVVSLKIEGTINPVASAYIRRGIEEARKEKAECLIIHLNTPGGLLKSTRVIVSDILDSPVPVVVYVSPGGAHAGSAGVFITLAAHIAAMAPGTNIGAAHPVSMQGQQDSIMSGKATNDAAAFVRTIAENRHRNGEWAEEAVRKSVSVTATEALKLHVIDLIAENTEELLHQMNGKKLVVRSDTLTLQTKNARLLPFEMSLTEKLLDLISDPNVAYILLLLGMYGMLFELYSPGAIFPGIVGVICLILAFYAMHTLPVNYAGLALIIFGIILFLLEIKITSHGLLAIGGVISLLLGSLMLIRTDSVFNAVRISWSVIISSVGITALFFLFVVGLGLRAQRLKPVTGIEGLIGEIGEAFEILDPSGRIQVHGETWNAESVSGKIGAGERVRVREVNNLSLRVERV